MAVASPVEKIPKSEPDMSKLNGFTGCITTVVKHLQARNSVGTTVFPTATIPLQQLLQLVTSLPLQNGPGFYKFTVVDAGGNGEDVWMTKLGGEIPEVPNMAVMPPSPESVPGAPTGPNVQHLGRGYFYNAELGVLTTPWGTAVNWSRGEPLPQPPSSNNQSHLAAVPPNATPWSWQGPQNFGGWGSFPVDDSSSRTKQLEAQLAEERRTREMDSIRAEMRRQSEEQQRRMDEQSRRFETLLEKLTARPSGPSESEQRLQAEIAEQRRRTEEAERRAEENRREAERREEARRQDDQRRAELRDMETKFERTIRELTANKQDATLPMLMQLITSQQTSAMEAVKAIQAATQTGSAAAERSTQQMLEQLRGSIMSPLQLMQLLQNAKGDAADGAKMIIEASKDAMALQKDVFTQMLDVAGQGNQPWYASAIQGALDRAAQITAALAENRQQAQQQQQVQQQMQRRQMAPRANPVQQTAVGPMAGAAPAAITASGEPIPNTRPPGTRYDKATDEFILTDNRRLWQPYVQQWGWAHVLGLPPTVAEQEMAEMRKAMASGAATPTNGVPAAAPAAPVTGDVIPLQPPKKSKRGKKAKADTHEKIAEMIESMRDAEPEAVFTAIENIEDAELFGTLLFPYVENLRKTLPAPEEVATYVLQARGQIQGFGGPVPLALNLLDAGQIQVLVERLVPEAQPAYQDACVEAIGAALEAEDLGEDEEEEGDDE